MRAWDITLLLIVVQACIGLVNGVGLFDQAYFASQNDSTTAYTVGDISDLHDVEAGGEVSQTSYFDFVVTFGMAGINLLFKIIEAIVFIFPTLVDQFKIPLPLAAVLQSMIYLQIAWGYAQWKSNRSGRSTD
ncbi:MAG: hypothetical protein WC277_07945 [Bacilli bacterium]